MKHWALQELFRFADFKKTGTIDISQWRLFSEMYVDKFNKADADHDLLLKEAEIKT